MSTFRLAAACAALMALALPAAADCPAPAAVTGAPAAAPPAAPLAAGARPRIALVLSGGGARGFAHIGVLQVLEELHVPVQLVTATSMGAIVGGAYAAGYTPQQLLRGVETTDWSSMFANRAPRSEIDWRRKDDDYKNLSNFEFGIKPGGVTLPQGLAGAQRLDLFLGTLGGPTKDVHDLGELPVPFAAVATDLETGQAVVLQQQVSLATAMRASMAVPGAFAPIDVAGKLLADGGIVDNLPIDLARRMGADLVIAVNVSTPLLERDRITDVFGVAEQLSRILGLDSVQRQICRLQPQDILIEPVLDGLGSSDFGAYDRIVAAGRAAARALADRLAPLGVDAAAYAQLEQRRTRLVREDAPVEIADIQVAPLRTVNPAAVASAIDIQPGRLVNGADIDRSVGRVYDSGDFEAVNYALTGDPPRRTLLVVPFEKSWGYNTLRFGGSLLTDFRQDNEFNLLVAHSWRWLDAWGAEWRNELQIGVERRISSEFFQPLGPGSSWYLVPRLGELRESFQLFDGTRAVAEYANIERSAQLLFGRSLARLGTIEGGVARSELLTEQLVGALTPAQPASFSNDLIVHVRLDTLDNVNFPHSGFYADTRFTRYGRTVGTAQSQSAYTIELSRPLSLGRYTADLTARTETAVQQSRVQLGGLFNLSGTPLGQISGARGALLRAILERNVSDALGDIAMPIYVGLSFEAGTAVPQDAQLEPSGLRHANALFVGAESYIGPIFFAVGHTAGGSTAAYLLLGRPR